MHHQYLMQARHDDRLRTAAQHRLAAQARQARAATPPRHPARSAAAPDAGMAPPGRRLCAAQRPATPNPTFIKEIPVNRIHRIRLLGSILAGLAAGLLALAAASPAASAQVWPHPGRPAVPVQAPAQIHAIVTGGMAGWQIALIAVGAAVLAAATAVLLDRARTARRTTAPTA